ncbi:MAG: hypothetical protein ACKOX2_20100 [Microcystaceae cyanobacterium]
MLTQTLPKTSPTPVIDLPMTFINFTRSSGVATSLILEDRKDGTNYDLMIVSNKPLRNHEVKEAIAKATGRSHWDFKHEFIKCSDYEF